MRKIHISALAFLLALVAVAPQMRASAVKPAPANASRKAQGRATGEIIVKLKESTLKQSAALASGDRRDYLIEAARSVGERSRKVSQAVELIAPAVRNKRIDEIISARGLDRIVVLKYDKDADLHSIIAELNASGEVEYAEPNYSIELGSVIPDDPRFGEEWALKNLGLMIDDYPATLDADIKATEAWEITTGSPDVIVAVTDTGVDLTHPDLVNNIYTNAGEIPGNKIDDDHNGYVDDVHGFNVADNNGDTSDIVGHGTAMAGIIAAEMNNGIGISGVSQAKILPVQFFKKLSAIPEDYDATVADAARALVYSVAAGASVINASWKTLLTPGEVPEEFGQALKDAVNATCDAGALLVCIAGNEGYDNDVNKLYPGAYRLPNEIVVAASDYNDEIWHPPYSPYEIKTGFGQRTVHLAAPGVFVFTTQARGPCVSCTQSDKPEDWYTHIDGTSASAAFVSGVAALVKSKYPEDNGVVIKQRILGGVEVREKLYNYVITSGRLSAMGALQSQVTITPPTLTKIKYKTGGGGKLTLFGEKIQSGAVALVGGVKYPTEANGNDLSSLLARVPKTAFPKGKAVEIRLRNADGGTSRAVTYTR